MSAPKKPQDHKPKATDAEPSTEPVDREETQKPVTIDGTTYLVNLTALRNPRTADDIGVLQEAAAQGEDLDKELAAEITIRVPGLLRRVLGFAGSRTMHAALEKKHGDEYNFGHVTQFMIELIQGVRPNS